MSNHLGEALVRRIRYMAALITLVLAGIGPLGGTARAAFPGADGKIAFTGFSPDRIFTMNPDGSGVVAVTPANRLSYAAAWSPDGTKIAFVRTQRPSFQNAVLVANADGSGVTTVVPFAPGRFIANVAWSPDGSTIAYCAIRQHSAVFTVNANGTGLTKVTIGDHEDCDPAWSPDGASIAMTTHLQDQKNSQIVTINPDGTGRTSILNVGFNYSPDWSPNGSHLTLSRFVKVSPGVGYYDIFTVHADGTHLKDITDTALLNEWQPAYSPAGTRIVYSRDQGRNAQNRDIWVRHAGGTGPPHRRTDTPSRSEYDPSWQPII